MLLYLFYFPSLETQGTHQHSCFSCHVLLLSVIQVGSLQSFSDGLPLMSIFRRRSWRFHTSETRIWRFHWIIRSWSCERCRMRGDTEERRGLKRVGGVRAMCDVHSDAYEYPLQPVAGIQALFSQYTTLHFHPHTFSKLLWCFLHRPPHKIIAQSPSWMRGVFMVKMFFPVERCFCPKLWQSVTTH